MKLTLTPTEHFFMAGDVTVRMWEGTDERNQPLIALVAGVAFGGQAEAITENLISIPPPDPETARAWARKLLEGMGEESDA